MMRNLGAIPLFIGAIIAPLTIHPAAAWALCPNCLGQTAELTPTLKVLGVFLTIPFVVSFVVFRAIRRACRGQP